MKLTPGYTKEEREQYWVKIITAARRSPLGIKAYLESVDVQRENYYQWFKVLRKSRPEWNDLGKDPKYQAMKARAKKKKSLPKTEVTERAERRRFSPAERHQILNEYENQPRGKGSAYLRKVGIYSSQVQQWRQERDENRLEARKRGPKANPESEEIRRLKAQLARSEKKLFHANTLIELQKKISEILKTSLKECEEGK
jgi:transposase